MTQIDVASAAKPHVALAKGYMYRIASVLMLLFAVGHTLGALIFPPNFGAQAGLVLASMKAVHFSCSGSSCTWYQLYIGFGWFCTVFFLFTAVVAWCLGGLTLSDRHAFLPVSWALFSSYLAGTVISFLDFFIAPRTFAVAITILLAVAIARDRARAGRQVAAPS